VSVAEETGDPQSLLSFYRRVLAIRRSRAELREGDERILTTDRSSVLAVLRTTPAAASLLLVNLSDTAATAAIPRDSLPGPLARGRLADLLAGGTVKATGGTLRVALPPYGVKLLGSRGGAR